MAVVTCDKCGARYDDTYRLTYCPHQRFDMTTSVYRDGKFVGVATSLEELDRLSGTESERMK